MTLTASNSIALEGELQAKGSYPEYTRLVAPNSLPSVYVEFLTSSILNQNPVAPLSADQIYVSVNTSLYFSDYITPAPTTTFNPGLHVHPDDPLPTPTGLILLDGSPVSTTQLKGKGPVDAFSGTAKDGDTYNLSLVASNVEIGGRVSNDKSNWAFCHAFLTVANQPGIEMGVGFSPAELLVTFFVSYGEILSFIEVDLSPVVGTGGYAKVTRVITYQGKTFSSTMVNMPTGDGAPMTLPTSPVHQFVLPIVTVSPALASIVGPLEKQPQPNPLAALNSLDFGLNVTETQASYVDRGTTITGPALAALLALLGQSAYPGFSDLSHWLGWSLAGIGRSNVEAAFTACYISYVQWLKLHAGTTKPTRLPSMRDSNGGFAQQAIQELFDRSTQK